MNPDNTTGRRSPRSLEPPRVCQQFQIVWQNSFILTMILKVLEREWKIFSLSSMWKRKLFTRLIISKIMFSSNHNADKPSRLTCNIWVHIRWSHYLQDLSYIKILNFQAIYNVKRSFMKRSLWFFIVILFTAILPSSYLKLYPKELN